MKIEVPSQVAANIISDQFDSIANILQSAACDLRAGKYKEAGEKIDVERIKRATDNLQALVEGS